MLNNLKKSLVFSILGFIAGVVIVPAQAEMIEKLLSQGGVTEVPLLTISLVTGVQIAVLSFIFSFLGLLMIKKVNLKLSSSFSMNWVIFSILGGMGGMGIMVLLDYFVFLPRIPQMEDVNVTWWKGLLGGLLYGGIFEEILLRLFMMTFIVWVLVKIKKVSNIPDRFYWTGIILASLLFAVGHIQITSLSFGELSPVIIFRTILMNGAMAVLFGYLYWKKGLSYSILAHMSSHIFLYGIVKGLIS